MFEWVPAIPVQGADWPFVILLGFSALFIMLSFVMMNEARDRVHTALGKTNSNTRLSTANMFLFLIVVAFFLGAFYEYFFCKRAAAAKTEPISPGETSSSDIKS